MNKTQIHFIVNPIAGKGKLKNIAHQIKTEIDPVFDVRIYYTKRKGHANEIAKFLSENKKNVIIAVGGDGTVNEVAKNLVNKECIFGIIPIGSGNGLANHLNIPKNISKGIKKINEMKVRNIDSATVNEDFFINVSGIGYEGHIADCFSKSKKRGITTYLKLILSEWWSYSIGEYEVEIDKKIIFKGKATQISFANGTQFGNNAMISPNSIENDGLIELCILEPFSFYEIPIILFLLVSKRIYKYPKMYIFSCRHAKIKSSYVKLHLDGEVKNPTNSFEIKVLNKSVQIIS